MSDLNTKKKYFDDNLSYKSIFLGFVLFRLLNIFLNQTWFVPDEYWQSQEVAHHLAFNYGYLTWEWKVGIRSYLYPFVISNFYKFLNLIYLDNTDIFIYVSPIFHSILTALGDLYFLVYVKKFFDLKTAYLASLCRTLSWYTLYTSTRSLTNNLEETFTIFCLASLEKMADSKVNFYQFHFFAFISFIVRSTAAINLIPIYCYQFLILCNRMEPRIRFIWQFILVGLGTISVSILVDSYFHGKFLISWYNFLLYNVFHNIGIHYGTHPWNWYITQGYPTLLFLHLFLFVFGLKYFKSIKFPLFSIFFNIFVYSLLAHKEFRFLSQILPFSMIVCALGIEHLKHLFGKNAVIKSIVIIGVGNILLCIFVGVFHQRAPISLMHHLRRQNLNTENDSLLFLTPCHSTPFYSYLHKNVSMRFLTCEPNLLKNENKIYQDEADRFYLNPNDWYKQNEANILNTTHLILFEKLYNELKNQTDYSNEEFKIFIQKFKICKKFFNSWIQQSSRTDQFLLLLCLNDSDDSKDSYQRSDEL